MNIHFTKMQGAGNDFVVIDAYTAAVRLSPVQIKFIANRYFGVGCDQLLLVEKTSTPNVDFKYRIFNADGGEVEQCGNGARCFVRFVVEKGLTDKRDITVETASGVIRLQLQDDGQVTVDMGAPKFDPAQIPFVAEDTAQTYALALNQTQVNQTLVNQTQVNQTQVTIGTVNMGNPHAVTVVEDVATAPVADWGPQIESHARFPQRVNAGFMQVVQTHEINLRVYERGSGETLACGTGACAAVVSGIVRGLLKSPVKVNTRGGTLHIAWAGEGQSVMMTGPAEIVFEGQITLPDHLPQ